MATTPDGEGKAFQSYERVVQAAQAAVKGLGDRSLLVAAAAGLAVGLDHPAQAASLSILIYVITKR
jgi:hypothetical protein